MQPQHLFKTVSVYLLVFAFGVTISATNSFAALSDNISRNYLDNPTPSLLPKGELETYFSSPEDTERQKVMDAFLDALELTELGQLEAALNAFYVLERKLPPKHQDIRAWSGLLFATISLELHGDINGAGAFAAISLPYFSKNNDNLALGIIYVLLALKESLVNKGSITSTYGGFPSAEKFYNKAISYFEKADKTRFQYFAHIYLAQLYIDVKKIVEAEQTLTRARELLIFFDAKETERYLLIAEGHVAISRQKTQKALYSFDQARQIAENIDNPLDLPHIYLQLADLNFSQAINASGSEQRHGLAAAKTALQKLMANCANLGDIFCLGMASVRMSKVSSHQQDHQAALDQLDQGINYFTRANQPGLAADSQVVLARYLLKLRQAQKGCSDISAAAAYYKYNNRGLDYVKAQKLIAEMNCNALSGSAPK